MEKRFKSFGGTIVHRHRQYKKKVLQKKKGQNKKKVLPKKKKGQNKKKGKSNFKLPNLIL